MIWFARWRAPRDDCWKPTFVIYARERQQGTTADSHSLEEAQFKTLRSACSLKPESQIENRIRCVTLGYPSLLPDTPGIFALLPSLFTSAVECLSTSGVFTALPVS